MSGRVWVLAVVVVGVVGLLAGCSSSLTDTQAQLAPQGYGKGAQYQVEISLNCTSARNCTLAQVLGHGKGFGVWLWLELSIDASGNHTGDYTGADCGHRVEGTSGALPDAGDLTWSDDGTYLTITGVKLFGGTVPVTIKVHDQYGHYVYTDGSDVISVPPSFPVTLDGVTQVQVAP